MSKIGKISISIPEKVKVVLAENIINIEGPLGKKSVDIDLEMFNLDIKEGKEISIKPKKIDQNSKRLWGMNGSHPVDRKWNQVVKKYFPKIEFAVEGETDGK